MHPIRGPAAALAFMLAIPGASASGPSLEERQQAACYDDVMRLCGDAVPDVEAVRLCMKPKKQQVSPACAAFYPAKDPR